MKHLRLKLKILWYGIRVNFSLKKALKPKFLLSCFVKLAPGIHQVNLIKCFNFENLFRILIFKIVDSNFLYIGADFNISWHLRSRLYAKSKVFVQQSVVEDSRTDKESFKDF